MTNRKSLHAPKLINYILRHIQAFKLSIAQLSFEPFATFMTFAVIGIALALPMGLYVLLQNIHSVTSGLHNTAQISLYLDKNIQRSQVDTLMQSLRNDVEVSTVKYISPDQGLSDFQNQFNFGDVLTELNKNPLPGVIEVQPIKSLHMPFQIQQLLDRLKTLPQVHEAQLDMAWLHRLNAMIVLGHRLVYALMILFAFGVFLIIGNTIRLITQRYKEEIAILKLLGGTQHYIRRPFLYSGIIYGLLGGIIAWFLVDGVMWWLHSSVEHLANLYGVQFELQGLTSNSTLALLCGGVLLGYLGSWLAVGKHINSIEPG